MMQVMEDRKRTELASVQYLRALAALFVVYFHTAVYNARFPWPDALPRGFGAAGVDMFFVISGFIMMMVTATRPTSPSSFLRRRVLRIVPLYWGVTLAVAVLALVYPTAMLENMLTAPHLILSMLFLPHANPLTGAITPFFKIGWTLNYEMYFYVLFAVCLCLRSPASRLLALAGYAACVSLVFLAIDPKIAVLRVYLNPIIFEFVMGAAIGYLYLGGHFVRLGSGIALAVCAASVVALLTFPVDDASRLFLKGAPAAALLCGLLALEARGRLPRIGWLLLLGDASYSMYLVHPIVETLFRVATWPVQALVGSSILGPLATVLAVLTSVLAGVLVYRVIELPLLKFLLSRGNALGRLPLGRAGPVAMREVDNFIS